MAAAAAVHCSPAASPPRGGSASRPRARQHSMGWHGEPTTPSQQHGWSHSQQDLFIARQAGRQAGAPVVCAKEVRLGHAHLHGRCMLQDHAGARAQHAACARRWSRHVGKPACATQAWPTHELRRCAIQHCPRQLNECMRATNSSRQHALTARTRSCQPSPNVSSILHHVKRRWGRFYGGWKSAPCSTT